MAKSRGQVQTQIRRIVKRLVRRFHPDRIILFGSHARGNASPDSDVDILVVMPVEGAKREAQLQIRAALHDVRLPKDVILSTPDEFAWRKDVVGTIEYPAAREGKVLYARICQGAAGLQRRTVSEEPQHRCTPCPVASGSAP
ncbi:MAG: nucleotidyltransferase domain-containing protein [Kiritimatiellae bacterium]|nr:nucleotidyltransferase domain-containing protein [Kiritimatiellia bacterium]